MHSDINVRKKVLLTRSPSTVPFLTCSTMTSRNNSRVYANTKFREEELLLSYSVGRSREPADIQCIRGR